MKVKSLFLQLRCFSYDAISKIRSIRSKLGIKVKFKNCSSVRERSDFHLYRSRRLYALIATEFHSCILMHF